MARFSLALSGLGFVFRFRASSFRSRALRRCDRASLTERGVSVGLRYNGRCFIFSVNSRVVLVGECARVRSTCAMCALSGAFGGMAGVDVLYVWVVVVVEEAEIFISEV
jgi:hypothetical protein